MGYIYTAAVWCDPCGEAIRVRLNAESHNAPSPDDDESFYDSDDYPKVYLEGDAEADCPQHCDAGAECLTAETLSNRDKVGALLDSGLSPDGYTYVRDAVAEAIATGAEPGASVALSLWAERWEVATTCDDCAHPFNPAQVRAERSQCYRCDADTPYACAKRFQIGDAVVTVAHTGRLDNYCKPVYQGSIYLPDADGGPVQWDWEGLALGGSLPDPRSDDMQAASAILSFATYPTSENRGDDVPDWAPSADVADAIESAVMCVTTEDGEYAARAMDCADCDAKLVDAPPLTGNAETDPEADAQPVGWCDYARAEVCDDCAKGGPDAS